MQAAEATRTQLAEAQAAKVAAERAAEEARTRLAFVSQEKNGGSVANIDELRKQMHAEQAAREAAEREIAEARSSLARERSQRQAAWRTVEQLKKRLAMVGANPQIVQQVPAPKKPFVAPRPPPAENRRRAAGGHGNAVDQDGRGMERVQRSGLLQAVACRSIPSRCGLVQRRGELRAAELVIDADCSQPLSA